MNTGRDTSILLHKLCFYSSPLLIHKKTKLYLDPQVYKEMLQGTKKGKQKKFVWGKRGAFAASFLYYPRSDVKNHSLVISSSFW